MIKGKIWSQMSLLELTRHKKVIRRSLMTSRPSKISFFPLAILVEDQSTVPQFMLSPETKFILIWNCTSILIVIFQSIYIPFLLSFEIEETNFFFVFETFSAIFFTLDILISFNLAIYKEGVLITDRKQILKSYIKKRFIIDFLAVFPYYIVSIPNFVSDFVNHNPGIKFLSLLKLLRMLNISKMLYEIKEKVASKRISTSLMILELLCQVLFCAHLFGCIFYAIGNYESKTHADVWLNKCYLETNEMSEIYITALYWSITTMATVGYGDIAGQTNFEIGYVMVIMMISCCIFGYIIGVIEGISLDNGNKAVQHRDIIEFLNDFMKKNSIPSDLQFKVKKYMHYVWETQEKAQGNESEILSYLSNELRELVCVYSRGHFFNNFSVFNRFDQKFLKKITMIIRYCCFAPNDGIFESGEKSRNIYFIQEGEAILEDYDTGCVIKRLTPSSHFGEIAFFLGSPRCCKASSISYLETLTIYWEPFSEFLVEDPEADLFFSDLQVMTSEEALSAIKIECYYCSAIGHCIANCNLLDHGKNRTKDLWMNKKVHSKSVKVLAEAKKKFIFPKYLRHKSEAVQRNSSEGHSSVLSSSSNNNLYSIKKTIDYSIYSESDSDPDSTYRKEDDNTPIFSMSEKLYIEKDDKL